jgi:non-specific serine/threonine protein kinase/serine/threonine-protein kinase
MALRKEPERRYASVEQFAEDIRRYLQRLPVIARRDTFLYRSSAFIARHKFAVATAGVIAVLLVCGIVVTWHEARIAESQRARAEQRFDEVRKLANALIFDVHDSIRYLPGAADSRRLLAKTAARYLDSLAKDAANDPALQRELAAAYERLGDVQGQPREVNEGDYIGAMQSYQRALALRSAALSADPHNVDARRDILVNYGKLSDLSWNSGEAQPALSLSRQTITNAELLVAADSTNKVYQRMLAASLGDYGYKLFKIRGATDAALPYMRRSIAALEALSASDPSSVSVGRVLCIIYGRTAEMLKGTPQRLEEALSLNEKAQKVLESLVARAPQNADLRHLQAFSDLNFAEELPDLGRLDQAAQHAQSALDAFHELRAADPKAAEYSFDAGKALAALADVAVRRGQPGQAISELQTALDGVKDSGPTNAYFRITTADEELLYGRAFAMRAADPHRSSSERQKDWQSARDAFGKALEMYEELMPAWAEAAAGARAASAEIQHCERALAMTLNARR